MSETAASTVSPLRQVRRFSSTGLVDPRVPPLPVRGIHQGESGSVHGAGVEPATNLLDLDQAALPKFAHPCVSRSLSLSCDLYVRDDHGGTGIVIAITRQLSPAKGLFPTIGAESIADLGFVRRAHLSHQRDRRKRNGDRDSHLGPRGKTRTCRAR